MHEILPKHIKTVNLNGRFCNRSARLSAMCAVKGKKKKNTPNPTPKPFVHTVGQIRIINLITAFANLKMVLKHFRLLLTPSYLCPHAQHIYCTLISMGVFEKYQRCVTLMFTWFTWLLIRTKMGQSAIVTIALVKVQEQTTRKIVTVKPTSKRHWRQMRNETC